MRWRVRVLYGKRVFILTTAATGPCATARASCWFTTLFSDVGAAVTQKSIGINRTVRTIPNDARSNKTRIECTRRRTLTNTRLCTIYMYNWHPVNYFRDGGFSSWYFIYFHAYLPPRRAMPTTRLQGDFHEKNLDTAHLRSRATHSRPKYKVYLPVYTPCASILHPTLHYPNTCTYF